MNTINFFNSKKNFPLSVQVVDFMQSVVKSAFQLAKIGGKDRYILDGCMNTTGNTWTSGYVVINGELLPFVGGTGQATVRIREDKTNIIAGYETYTDVYVTRVVEFGSNLNNVDTYSWAEFEKLTTNSDIVKNFATKAELDAVRLLVMPKGAIIEFDILNNPTIPTGWRFCNGDTVEGYGKLPDKKRRVTVGYDPDAPNTPNNVVDDRNADGSVIQNYGKVGNTGGKHEVKLTKQESGLPDHTVDLGYHSLIDGGGTQREGWLPYDPDVHVFRNVPGFDAEKSHENRMAYTVGYHIVKIV